MRQRLAALAIVLGILGMAVPAAAVPIQSGEAILANLAFSPAIFAIIRVDFEVYAPGDASAPLGPTADFQYVYQVEATTGPTCGIPPCKSTAPLNDVSSFTITFNNVAFTSITTAAGNLVIGSESNAFDGHPLSLVTTAGTPSGLDPGTANWTFSPNIPHDGQSDKLIGRSPFGPMPGGASALDGLPGSPWSTAALGGTTVPVPIPEPGTLLLLGLALGSLGFVARKK